MKMRKLLSIVLAVMFAAGMLPIGAYAHQGISLNYNFNDFTAAANAQVAPENMILVNGIANKAGALSETNIVPNPGDGEKSLKFIGSSYSNAYIKTNNIGIMGTIFVEMNLYFADTNLFRSIVLQSGETEHNLINFKRNQGVTIAGSNDLLYYQLNKWYHIAFRYNTLNNMYDVEMSAHDGSHSFRYGGYSEFTVGSQVVDYVGIRYLSSGSDSVTYTDNWKISTEMPLEATILKTDFNNYTATNGTPPVGNSTGSFAFQNTDSTSDEVFAKGVSMDTERGKSVKFTNTAGKNLEMVYNVSAARSQITSGTIIVKASMKFDDFDSTRMILLRDEQNAANPYAQLAVRVDKSGYFLISDKVVQGLVAETGKWYDITYSYDMNSFTESISIFDGENTYRLKGPKKFEISKLTKVHFSTGSAVNGVLTNSYFDDIEILASSEKIYYASEEKYNFNQYVSGIGNESAPEGFEVLNHTLGNTEITGNDEGNGNRSVRLYSLEQKYAMQTVASDSWNGFLTDIRLSDKNADRIIGLASGETLGTIVEFGLNGKLKIGGIEKADYETGIWYSISISQNASANVYQVSVYQGDTLIASGGVDLGTMIPASKNYAIIINEPALGSAETFIDNISLAKISAFGIESATPAHRSSDNEPPKKGQVTFITDIRQSSITGGSVKLYKNGVQETIKNIKLVGTKTIEVESDAGFAENQSYEIRFSDIKDVFGNSFTGTVEFDTGSYNLIIHDTVFSKDVEGEPVQIFEIESGIITATIKVSASKQGYSQSAVWMVALYEDKNLVSVDMQKILIDNTEKELVSEVDVPGNGKYEIKSFLWSDMTPLKEVEQLS